MVLSRFAVHAFSVVSIFLFASLGRAGTPTSGQPAAGWEYAVIYVDHLNRTYSLDYRGERKSFDDYNAFVDAMSGARMFEGERKPDERMPYQVRQALRSAGWRLVSAGSASQGTAEVDFVRRPVKPQPRRQPEENPWRIIPDDTEEAPPHQSR